MPATQTRPTTPTPDSHPQSDPPPPGGRGPDGRFTRGNGFGAGNPFYRRQAEFRRAALELFTPKDVMSLLRVMLALGRQGDVAAAKVFLEYVVGKPHKAPDPDREEQHERQLSAESPRLGQLTDLLGQAVPADLANDALPDSAYGHLNNVFAARNGAPPVEPAPTSPEADEAEPAEAAAAEPAEAQRGREALRLLTATLRAAVAGGGNGEAVEKWRQVARLTGDDGGARPVPMADDGGRPGAGPGTASHLEPNGDPGPRVV
jgi:hypothetical protein